MMQAVEQQGIQHVRPQIERWVCDHCGRTLGLLHGSTVEITVRRRVITAQLPCAQVCGDCGSLNMRNIIDVRSPV
jgi:hypothetical protein